MPTEHESERSSLHIAGFNAVQGCLPAVKVTPCCRLYMYRRATSQVLGALNAHNQCETLLHYIDQKDTSSLVQHTGVAHCNTSTGV